MFSEDVTYAADQLKQLVGFVIVDTVMTEDNESYGFIVERQAVPGQTPYAKKVCWVDMDPEGNGPGWISIQEQDDAKVNNVTSG